MASDGFYLGGKIDAATGDRVDEERLTYDPSDLTTHGVIVGMTGSGKTGLGIIYLEEALLNSIPTLVLDPKGDMTNLLLTFPDLLASDFEPWIDEAVARKDGKTVGEVAASTADLWTKGLASWDQDGTRIAKLRDAAGFTVYTPGSTSGVPLNIVGSLRAPQLSWDDDAEALRDEIQGFVSGLLGLVGIAADPISSREHILLSNLIEHNWRQGISLDMASLLGQITTPPLRKLGVFELDTFFPEKDRLALAMKLNGLVASPAFSTWIDGPDLDIGSMLWDASGKPQAAIVYLAHLSDEERQFIVTLILSKVVTWMRTQSGTGDLRAMVYMDEVYGFVPPTAQPPAKKPILTLLKQARAFGVGLLLSTQNPVDLDYKAMSNAGTWCIGRLQTERDKSRIIEALKSASGTGDIKALDASISGLGKRQFLLHNTREAAPTIFTTRWAMSYLRGPLTKDQVTRLGGATQPPTKPTTAPGAPIPNAGAEAAQQIVKEGPPTETLADDETPLMPEVADDVAVYAVDHAAPWLAGLGAPGSRRHQAAIAAKVRLTYDDTAADLSHQEEWEAIFSPLGQPFDPVDHVFVDYDDRDFRRDMPADAVYVLADAKIHTKTYFRDAQTAIKNMLYHSKKVEVLRNPALKMYSRVGEERKDFFIRCDAEAQKRADEEAAKLRDKYDTRIKRVKQQILDYERRADELEVDLQGRRQKELMDQAGAVIGWLTGRKSTRSITGSARSRSARQSKEQRLRTAQDKVGDKVMELDDLEREIVAELEEINDAWEDTAGEIEAVEIGLEKDDIQIVEIALVWLPVD